MSAGDVRIVRGTPVHVFELDAEACRWLASLVPASDMFRQELNDAADALESIASDDSRHPSPLPKDQHQPNRRSTR